MLLGEAPERKDILCSACKRYKKILEMPFKKQLREAMSNYQ
jgi:hypothetical protein